MTAAEPDGLDVRNIRQADPTRRQVRWLDQTTVKQAESDVSRQADPTRRQVRWLDQTTVKQVGSTTIDNNLYSGEAEQ